MAFVTTTRCCDIISWLKASKNRKEDSCLVLCMLLLSLLQGLMLGKFQKKTENTQTLDERMLIFSVSCPEMASWLLNFAAYSGHGCFNVSYECEVTLKLLCIPKQTALILPCVITHLCTVLSVRLLEISLMVPGIGTILSSFNDGQSLVFRPYILKTPKMRDI